MPKLTCSPSDARFVEAMSLARRQGYVASRPQLYALGITRWEIRGHVRARRWQLVGDQSVLLHNGDSSRTGQLWAAVLQGGPRAMLDGASALEAGGLVRFDHERVRVTVPRGARVRRTPLFDIRQSRRWAAEDRAPSGIPRARPAVAAVRAALWATSDEQATLLLTTVVQQGVSTAEQIGLQLIRIRRDRRRLLLHAVVNELLGGARSTGELEIVAGLRRRGLPEPDRQSLRQDRHRRFYLDLHWPAWHLVVEVDGIHHGWVESPVADALRHNRIALADDTVLRVPLLGLRLCPEEFFDQIARALTDAGWAPPDVMRSVA